MPKFPEPPDPLAVPPDIVKSSKAGNRWWRVYFAEGTHPTAWRDFRHFGPTQARFDHHDPPAQVQARGIFYAATSPVTCLAEVFQATRVIDRVGRKPWLVAFQLTQDVPLLNLMGTWPTLAGASMAISSGPRPKARRWARAIYAACPKLEGILYGSSMYKNEPSVALFERALPSIPAAPVFHRALADAALLPYIDKAAVEIGYGLV